MAVELGVLLPTREAVMSGRRETGPLLAIRDQPSWFEDGDLGSEEERERTFRWWREIGGFVLVWAGTEHTLDGNGVRFQ